MTRRRLTDTLAVSLGGLYVVAGLAETTRAILTGDGGIPFWFGSLVGGGTLILLGTLAFRDRPKVAAASSSLAPSPESSRPCGRSSSPSSP